MSTKQQRLFYLAPRDEGKTKIKWSKGGIRKLRLQRFKRFEDFSIDFSRITLLVGTNSSGKTSILQAIRLFFWCIEQCLRKEGRGYEFKKAVIPFSDFHLIPAFNLRELSFKGISPNSRERGILLEGSLESGMNLTFRIYSSYSTLMVIYPEIEKPKVISEEKISYLNRSPLYIPGFFGVVTRELLAHDARLEELLNSGHHNEVLRNIILRIKGREKKLSRLLGIMRDEFLIKDMQLPFSEKSTEYLKAEYLEPEMRIPLDFVSAGSGFLQVLQIMAHALQNPSPILLIDEPDAHMHCSLQKSFLRVLHTFADEEELQVIMASHSETFLRESNLQDIRVIDASWPQAGKFDNVDELKDQLSLAGILPTQLELTEIIRTKRILLLEGKEDKTIIQELGRKKYNDWDTRSKLVQVIFSEGSDENTVRRLEYVREILGHIVHNGELKIAHLRDRDLLCDPAADMLRSEAKKKNLPLFISDYRNRESILVQPNLVELAIRKQYGTGISNALKEKGSIERLVIEQILLWCKEQQDVLPVKVQEYNKNWIRRAFENEQQREGEELVTRFIRENWQEPISNKKIPWKLIDGKAILRLVRTKLQEFKIMLTEEMLFNVMKENNFDRCMIQIIDEIYS